MSKPPPFDFVKAAFFLVAAVIAVHLVVVTVGVAFCWTHAEAIVEGKYKCDADSKLSEVLAAALAAALAFAGGMSRKS